MAGQVSSRVAQDGGNPFLRLVGWISTVTGWVAAAMILTAVFITCQMIFIRFVLNGSTTWQTEAVIYLVIGATLIGLGYVQRLRGHVNVELVPLALPKGARKVMAAITLSGSIVIVGIMLFYSYEHWHFAWDRGWRSDTVWGPKLWIPYAALPIGFGLLLLQLVADLVALLLNIEKPFGLEDV